MSAQIIRFPIERRQHEPALDKKQLARVLGRSIRWIEGKVSDGMPSEMRNGKRVFFLSEVEPYLRRSA